MNAKEKVREHMMLAAGYFAGGDYIACNAHLEAASKGLVLVALEDVADKAEAIGGSTADLRKAVNVLNNGG